MAKSLLTVRLMFFPEVGSDARTRLSGGEQGEGWEKTLSLPAGSCLADALRASAFQQDFPDFDLQQWGVGVFGKSQPAEYVLQDNDRIEIYQPLRFDPMESRRRRAAHKAKRPKGARSVKVAIRS